MNENINHIGVDPKREFEKIHLEIFESSKEAVKLVSKIIAEEIISKQKENKKCVLGLATGSSPILLYDELIRMHREEGLSFKNVVSFNLDEYYGLSSKDKNSYNYFMDKHFFKHIDIDTNSIHIPDGKVKDVLEYAISYENIIEEYGGIDIQILGIGRTGHIGFNEPGSHHKSKTRLVNLDYITRLDAAGDFNDFNNVPKQAITMGINTIMKSRRILLMAWGVNKAEIVKKAVEGNISSIVPASFLQSHSNTCFILDNESSKELTRIKLPWKVGDCKWSEQLKKKAVIWLSLTLDKNILRLTERDYNENGLSELLNKDSVYNINLKVFKSLHKTITGWPSGKGKKKKILIFSPHPDDDVISMGGTFLRLIDQGHDVHVAYQTSGNIAVFNADAIKFIEFSKDLNSYLFKDRDKSVFDEIISEISKSKDNDISLSPLEMKIKGFIRRGEARAACKYYGLGDDNIHNMNLPFYETGKVKKNNISNEDIKLTMELISKIKPDQIYSAGDLADPHGTHKVCLDVILRSLQNMKDQDFIKGCKLWLYKGAWEEWPIEEIEMAIPLSPNEFDKKKSAILFHQSQMGSAMFQGSDGRDFWQRAKVRNRNTAKLYDKLGLPEYEAIEAFKSYDYLSYQDLVKK